MSTATAVLDLLSTSPPTLGTGRVLCIDGRAGSGKSTLADEVAALSGATVVRTDDLCPGWDGLSRVPGLLADLLAPLSAGDPGSYPRYDWNAGRAADRVVVEPSDLLVLEGLGAGARALRPFRTVLVWLDCPVDTRRTRALARDGDTFAPYWETWAAAEDAYLRDQADRDRADLVLAG